MKKTLLSLGTLTAVVVPVASVVACGSSNSIDITKGDGKTIVDALDANWGFKALTGDITNVKTNMDFDKIDQNKIANKFVEVFGPRGTAKIEFTNDEAKPFKLFYKDAKDKKMKEYKQGDLSYDCLENGAQIVMHALGFI